MVALGRKNYLFAGSDAGGERAAAIYSLIGTAKLNGIDPEAYLARCARRASPTTRSTASTNSCPGTLPPSQKLLRYRNPPSRRPASELRTLTSRMASLERSEGLISK